MHILVIPSWYYDETNPISGISFKEQAQALSAIEDVEVGLMYGKFDWRESVYGKVAVDRSDGFLTLRGKAWAPPKVTWIGVKAWQYRYMGLFEKYRSIAGEPAIIHAHSWVAGLVGRAINELYGIPYVVSEHLSSVNRGVLSERQTTLASVAYDKAVALTAVSQQMVAQLRELTTQNDIYLLPNAVDTDFFLPKGCVNDQPRVLLSIGDPWHVKGHDVSVKALALLKQRGYDFELWLGDKIPERKSLYQLIESNGLSKQVKFLGLLTRSEVVALMHKADIYLSSSRVETFGITIIEALSCGLPVIATKTAGGLDIIGKREDLGILVDIGDEAALANAIIMIADQLGKYQPKTLHDDVSARFGKQVVAKRSLELYKRVLNDHRT